MAGLTWLAMAFISAHYLRTPNRATVVDGKLQIRYPPGRVETLSLDGVTRVTVSEQNVRLLASRRYQNLIRR